MPISNYHYVLCLIIGSKLPLERKPLKQIEKHKPFLATNSSNDKLKTILEELKPLPKGTLNDDKVKTILKNSKTLPDDEVKTRLEELKPLPYKASNDDNIINSISILKEQSEKILQLQKYIDKLLAQGTKYLSNVM